MNLIEYKLGMQLVLMVKDTGGFEGFEVFVNGVAATPPVEDMLVHRYTVPRPDERAVVAVRFGGNDGGASAMFDVSGGQKTLLDSQKGMKHVYVIEPGSAAPAVRETVKSAAE